jgi:non-specific serine/threonine protein kinase
VEEITFGTWLRQKRRMLDLTQEALAAQAGCARITLRRIENGALRPSQELALSLLENVGVPREERPQWVAFARGKAGLPIKKAVSFEDEPITNVPVPISTFIGREKEQFEIIKLVYKHRFVTLTGSGGVGKTRLSLKIGGQVLGEYAHGVWLVELASLRDPALLQQTVAKVFGIATQSDVLLIELLINFLSGKTVLLILDNCEHLLDACAQLIDALLKNCPNLKVIATSREPLNITGEAIYRVPSLELPDPRPILASLREYESVRLFEERAQLVQTDFSLTMENASSVTQICSRLDGIPLAIELATAKLYALSVQEIAEQLDECFDLLTGGSRTALPRHQTIRASIEWSWNLLTESERTLMRQLSVFAGGWTLESAQAICDGDVRDLTNSLLTKSLVVLTQELKGANRYRFHETVLQYARKKLSEAGDSELIHDRHLAYFVKLTAQAEPELYRSNQVHWANKLEDELDNFRAALDWALKTNVESGLRIASIPWRFWDDRGHLQEIGRWLAVFLECYHNTDALYVQALIVFAFSFYRRGNFPDATRIAEQSMEMTRIIRDRQLEAHSLSLLGLVTLTQGNVAEGVPLLEQSLAISRALGNKIGQANTLEWLSYDHNNSERAIAFSKESLGLYRELGHLAGIANSLMILARLTFWTGDYSSPVPWVEEALSISRQLGNQTAENDAFITFGILAYWKGDYAQAIDYFEESIRMSEKSGYRFQNLWTHIRMAHAVLRHGDLHRARKLFVEGINNAHKTGFMIALVYAIEGVASLNVIQGQLEWAIRLFAWADAVRERIDDQRPPVEASSVEKDLAVIRSSLNDTEYKNLFAEGSSMTTEQVIALALEG